MLKFPGFFRSKKQEHEPSKEEILEANPLEKRSEEQSKDPLVKEGQVTIQFTSASAANGGLLVGFFVSNGHSKKVKFDKVPLLLIDSDKRVLARQSFDGEIIGEIASGSSKACVARFSRDNVYVQDIPEQCQVRFDVPSKQPQHIQIQYQALPEDTTENQQQELERILAELPPMKRGQVSFSPLHAKITEQNELMTTVIVRNATDKKIKLGQIPMIVFDANQEERARGEFDIKDLTIEPSKAILLPLSFGPVSQVREIDLSNWSFKIQKDVPSKEI